MKRILFLHCSFIQQSILEIRGNKPTNPSPLFDYADAIIFSFIASTLLPTDD